MMKNIFKKKEESSPKTLGKLFYELETLEASPFSLALSSFQSLKESTKSTEELFYFLIEDSIYVSLYATFYEELIKHLKTNPESTNTFIERFQAASDERERLIAEEAQNHLNFIENFGMCEGCSSCENHKDVAELITPFQKGDINFFSELYIGMQTIQNAMEALIYDILPDNNDLAAILSPKDILEWRSQIFSYATIKTANHLHNL